jgi:hypothetical protein
VLIKRATTQTVNNGEGICYYLSIKVKQPSAMESELTSPSFLFGLLTSYNVWKYDEELFYYKRIIKEQETK